jgi:hypothetical protein
MRSVSSPVNETLAMENFQRFDVAPVLRQLLTRAEDFFGVLFVLTLTDELTRSQVPQ